MDKKFRIIYFIIQCVVVVLSVLNVLIIYDVIKLSYTLRLIFACTLMAVAIADIFALFQYLRYLKNRNKPHVDRDIRSDDKDETEK